MIRSKLESLAYSPDNKQYQDNEYLEANNISKTFVNSETGKISTWIVEPESAKGTVLHFHGSGYNVSKHIDHVAWLRAYGYRVVAFDYAGYGYSENLPTRKSVIDSSKSIIEWVEQRFPNSPVFVFGQSLGGAIASETIHILGKKFRGLIIDSSFARYRDIAVFKLMNRGYPAQVAKILSLVLTKQHDPIEYIHEIDIPTLFLHSKDDPIVPYEQSEQLHSKSKKSTLWLQKDRGHTDVFRPDFEDYRKRLINWMEKQL